MSPNNGAWIRKTTYGPGIWTVAHRGHSGSRRLDVWAYSDETTALRAAAKLALDCGLDEDHEAVKRYQQRDYRWIIDRHNEKSAQWQVLQVQVVNFIDQSGEYVTTSAEIDFTSPPTSEPGCGLFSS